LSEFGAFSGGDGSTTKIIEKVYIICANGTSEAECASKAADIK